MNFDRRNFIRQASMTAILAFGYQLFNMLSVIEARAEGLSGDRPAPDIGNFRYIYGNKEFRDEFLPFLINVFHLLPEKEFHNLIELTSSQVQTDREIYIAIQNKIDDIKPFLSDLRYALPALAKQKKVMTNQTLKLLGDRKTYEGHLEIGSTGRYIGALEEVLNIRGDVYLVHEKVPSYSPVDMIERGQISKIGKFVPMNNYKSEIASKIPQNSLDLVTVYIGFHHCPIDLREEFVTSIRDVMKPDGIMIVRDHDAHNEKMKRVVALAHDVFNMGTKESWSYNESELRNFYSLEFLEQMLGKFGFKRVGSSLLQEGDPTLNTLMRFKKA